MPQCCDGYCDIQSPAGKLHFKLAGAHPHAITAAQQEFKIFKNLGGKNLGECGTKQNLGWPQVAVRVKHAKQSLVDVRDSALGVERKHSGRDALENRFELPTSMIELFIRSAQVAARCLNLAAAS